MSATPVKLRAEDAEDIQVISAILQDAIAPVGDMAYNAAERNFIMVVHRLRREDDRAERLERICCAVNVRGVDKAQFQGLQLDRPGQMLELLAVLLEGESAVFMFAAGIKIRLQLAGWSMIVEDFGPPWPAQCAPCHDPEDGQQASTDGKAL